MMDKSFVKEFSDLTLDELYEILQARNEVFTVEQNCIEQDADGYDRKSLHVVIPFEGKLGAYCRLLPAGLKYPEWSIGRVITSKHARGQKLAHQLMKTAVGVIKIRGGESIRISAQSYLQKFYESHGFIRLGDEYLEANIPHIRMVFEFKA
jgi:ElaA protein